MARRVLKAVLADELFVIEPVQARFAWRFSRLAPRLMNKMATKFVAQQKENAH